MTPSTIRRVQAAAAYLRRVLKRLPPASGRQLVGRALTELEAMDGVEGESAVERIRDGVRATFSES